MKHLTDKEQIEILKILAEREIFEHGSGRMLFELNENANNDVFDIIPELDRSLRYVVKVAIGYGGMRQNEYERQMHEDNHQYYPLARIFCAGKYIIVMEEVDVCDDYDLYDYTYDDNDPIDCAAEYLDYSCDLNSENCENYEDELQDCAKRVSCIQALNDLIGHTYDNAQIGYSRYQNKYVTYDYGFNPGFCVSDQTSSLACEIRDSDFLKDYCSQLIEVIENDMSDADFKAIEDDWVSQLYKDCD